MTEDKDESKPPTTDPEHEVTPRDAVLSSPAPEDNKIKFLLEDLIRLHLLIHSLSGSENPKSADGWNESARQILKVLKEGKSYELAGLKDVPMPFMKSKGRVMKKDGDKWSELTDLEAEKELSLMLFEESKTIEFGDFSSAPYKGLKEKLTSDETAEDTPDDMAPDAKDAVLFPCDADNVPPDQKIYEQQAGNKSIFNLASQLVTSYTSTSSKRVEAALAIAKGLDHSVVSNDESKKKSVARFLVRAPKDEDSACWTCLTPQQATEFLLIFVFEVFLEKEVHIRLVSGSIIDSLNAEEGKESHELVKASNTPIDEPTDHDVLFGRGGMTNSHPGNRRFRDVIALHRPDYIRAIKLDKPAVARKIVKAIRIGNPPGRFLKKGEDGKWYDVGDKTAAEKTSQGLRERSNAEKRQRSALREALRIRKQDLADDDDSSSKKQKLSPIDDSTGDANPTMSYIGTNLSVPLSLSMKEQAKTKRAKEKKSDTDDLNTEGLPPNAVDSEGNILVTDYDILCGRGGLTNHHKGNKRFRDIVALHRADYIRAPKVQKPSVARVIVRAIRNGDPPGRFLKKDEKTGKWYDVGDKKAAEKTSQALREKTNEEREQIKRDPAGVGVLLPNPATYLAAVTAGPLFTTMPPIVVPTTKTDEGENQQVPAHEGEKDEAQRDIEMQGSNVKAEVEAGEGSDGNSNKKDAKESLDGETGDKDDNALKNEGVLTESV